MRRFRRGRVTLSAWVRWGILVVACLTLGALLTDRILLNPLAAIAETQATSRGIDAVNQILFQNGVSNTLQNQEFVTYEKDSQGRVSAYRINTQLINRVAAEAARSVHSEFRRLEAESFSVPLGAMLGIKLFAAAGPQIPFHLIPFGTVTTDIKQEFQSQGINQTRHHIWLHAAAKVRVVLPFISREIQISSDVPISETIIVGPVPNSLYSGTVGGVTLPAQQ